VLYLFDANVLITASRTYYPLDQVPEFWSWVVHQAKLGLIKLPIEILEEVLAGGNTDDPLLDWVKEHRDHLCFDEPADPSDVQIVLDVGYAPDLTDVEILEIGQDPFLIARAFGHADRCVVTVETSAPSKQRQNKKVPNVCDLVAVNCCNPFEAYRALGFRTSWKAESHS